jgi:hypothetical protein
MAGAEQDGFANLATDSDYNHLVKHVNANRFHQLRYKLLLRRDFLHVPRISYPKVEF